MASQQFGVVGAGASGDHRVALLVPEWVPAVATGYGWSVAGGNRPLLGAAGEDRSDVLGLPTVELDRVEILIVEIEAESTCGGTDRRHTGFGVDAAVSLGGVRAPLPPNVRRAFAF